MAGESSFDRHVGRVQRRLGPVRHGPPDHWTKQYDPSRLVDSASGWTDRACGRRRRYAHLSRPARRPEDIGRPCWANSAALDWPSRDIAGSKKNWGYRGVTNRQDLTRKYVELWKAVTKLRDERGLSAAVYTQLTDVETECNGLLTYDRAVTKVNAAKSAAALANGRLPLRTEGTKKPRRKRRESPLGQAPCRR